MSDTGETSPAPAARRGALSLRFRLAHMGRDRVLSAALAPGREVPDWVTDELRQIEPAIDAAADGLRAAGLTLDDLQATGVLSLRVTWAALTAAGRRLGAVLTDSLTYTQIADDFQLVRRLRAALDRLGAFLPYLVQMAVLLDAEAEQVGKQLPQSWRKSTVADALAVVRRSCGDDWDALVADATRRAEWQDRMKASYPIGSLNLDLRLNGQGWTEHLAFLKQVPGTDRGDIEQVIRRLWNQWAMRAEDYFAGEPVSGPDWADFVMTALSQIPSALLFDGYGALGRLDRSTLALLGAGAPEVPGWATIAGLRGLGFDGTLLKTLADSLESSEAPDKTAPDASFWPTRLAANAPAAPQGRLAIVGQPTDAALFAENKVPILFVLESEVTRHAAALDWLERHNVFRLDETSKPDMIAP